MDRSETPPDLHRPTFEHFVRQERSDSVLESAESRRTDLGRSAAAQVPVRPRVRLRVEGADSESSCGAGRAMSDALVHVHETVEQGHAAGRAFEFLPVVAAREPLLQPAMVNAPGSEEEVEVVSGSDRG